MSYWLQCTDGELINSDGLSSIKVRSQESGWFIAAYDKKLFHYYLLRRCATREDANVYLESLQDFLNGVHQP